MPTLTVTSLGKTKKGRDKAICGKDEYLLGAKCQIPPVGVPIDADTSESSFQGEGGKTISLWWMNSWQMAAGAPMPAQAPRSVSTSTNGGFPMNAAPTPSEEGYSDGERLTISNWVAAAITSGKVSDPVDIHTWVNASLYALRNAKADLYTDKLVPPKEFEDDKEIPF